MREAKVIADEMFSSGTIIETFCKNEKVSMKVSMNQARKKTIISVIDFFRIIIIFASLFQC